MRYNHTRIYPLTEEQKKADKQNETALTVYGLVLLSPIAIIVTIYFFWLVVPIALFFLFIYYIGNKSITDLKKCPDCRKMGWQQTTSATYYRGGIGGDDQTTMVEAHCDLCGSHNIEGWKKNNGRT